MKEDLKAVVQLRTSQCIKSHKETNSEYGIIFLQGMVAQLRDIATYFEIHNPELEKLQEDLREDLSARVEVMKALHTQKDTKGN